MAPLSVPRSARARRVASAVAGAGVVVGAGVGLAAIGVRPAHAQEATPAPTRSPPGMTPASPRSPSQTTPASTRSPPEMTPASTRSPPEMTPASPRSPSETTRAADERDPVLVRPFLQIMLAAVDFETSDSAAQLEIVPNPTSNLGVTLGAWGFSFSLSTDVGRVEPIEEYGDSDNFNLEFTYPFRVFGGRELDVTAFLHYHRTLSMSRSGAPRQIVDDAVITTLGLDAALVLDPDFSIADAFSDFAPRRGSSGSFFLRSSIDFWFLGFQEERDRRLIPDELSGGFGEFTELSALNEAIATLGGGYAYDWNFTHRFFLSMMGNVGLAGSLLELEFASGANERPRAIGVSLGLQLAGSFVTEHFHLGLVTGGVADIVNTHSVDVATQRLNTMLFAGVRF